MVARTRFFDDETMAAFNRGVDQVVVLGAGYDGRALRFGSPGVRWIEMDRPSTQRDKRRRLAGLNVDVGHIAFVEVDLVTDNLDAAFDAVDHATDRATLFICEGLFAYLCVEDVRSVCHTLRHRAAHGSILAANFFVDPSSGVFGRSMHRAVDGVLSLIGERRLAVFRPGDPERLLGQAGWTEARRHKSKSNPADGGSHLVLIAAEVRT